MLIQLSAKDQQIILQCLNAILNGRFLEGEFHTRVGVEQEELAQIVAIYPNVSDSDDNSNESLAINNCLNEVCYGINFSNTEWSCWFNVSKAEIEEVFQRWAKFRGWSRTGII